MLVTLPGFTVATVGPGVAVRAAVGTAVGATVEPGRGVAVAAETGVGRVVAVAALPQAAARNTSNINGVRPHALEKNPCKYHILTILYTNLIAPKLGDRIIAMSGPNRLFD